MGLFGSTGETFIGARLCCEALNEDPCQSKASVPSLGSPTVYRRFLMKLKTIRPKFSRPGQLGDGSTEAKSIPTPIK
jgi:hypothetical protein